MDNETIRLPGPTWQEKIQFKTIVKIQYLDVFEHSERDNSWPHHQILVDCTILVGGLECLPGTIYMDVEIDEAERLQCLRKTLQPGSILWVTSKYFDITPEDEQKITFYNPGVEAVTGEDLDDLLISLFEPEESEICLRGCIEKIKECMTKSSGPMAFVRLAEHAGIEVIVFAGQYAEWRDMLQIGRQLDFVGKLETNADSEITGKLLVKEILLINVEKEMGQ